MNTVSSTTVDIKKTLLHYIKAEFKEKDLDMLKSLLGSIYTELTNSTDILPHLENPDFSSAPLDCSDRIASDTNTIKAGRERRLLQVSPRGIAE